MPCGNPLLVLTSYLAQPPVPPGGSCCLVGGGGASLLSPFPPLPPPLPTPVPTPRCPSDAASSSSAAPTSIGSLSSSPSHLWMIRVFRASAVTFSTLSRDAMSESLVAVRRLVGRSCIIMFFLIDSLHASSPAASSYSSRSFSNRSNTFGTSLIFFTRFWAPNRIIDWSLLACTVAF